MSHVIVTLGLMPIAENIMIGTLQTRETLTAISRKCYKD